MKKRILFLALFIYGTSVLAQQDPQFSQNMHNRLFPNPGVAGMNDAICASLLYRQQWVGFDGNPETFLFAAHAPVRLLKGGIGLTLAQDQLGAEKNIAGKLSYSFHLPLGNSGGTLGIGAGLGFFNKVIGRSDWRATQGVDNDPSIPQSEISQTKFDLDFGLYYKSPTLYFGLSSTHLTRSTFDDVDLAATPSRDFNFQLSRHYYIMAGYNYELNPNITLTPSTFIKTDGRITQVDLNVTALVNNLVWGGVTYRVQDAIIPMVGIYKEVGGGDLKVGYSYDVTTSILRQYSSGSHEIYVGYCFSLEKPPSVTKHKTVRFL